MTEYIKREYAVDAVLGVYYDTPDIDLSGEKFEAAILKIPAADVAPVQEWISVDDRLPGDEQDVLVIAHGWDGRLVYVGSHKRVEAQKSWLTGITNKSSEWLLWGWSYLKEPMVTHWMPLPQPPKGE